KSTTKRQPRRSRPSAGCRPGRDRAPRGANRAAVLGVVGERPGVSASELSTASGVTRPVLYALLKTLEGRGEVVKEELPGGVAGYRLTTDASSESVAPAARGVGH
ncbi:MAG: hypothetical protein QOJ98_2315, partial [Acidobacteriota bacterium]|nr:hypothetical protein [Acidobacteriota bacterium]